MITRSFGTNTTSRFNVSALGLGAGALGEMSAADADDLLSAAWDLGVRFIDTARSYGASEEHIGRWLERSPGRRDSVVLSTKLGYGIDGVRDWTPECITRGVDEALIRLRTDVIDVVHFHSCPRDVLEHGNVIEPLERAREAGKIRVVAYSGENDALDWATTTSSSSFGAIQCSVNVFDQQSLDHAIANANKRGMGVIAKRSLGNAPWRFRDRPPHGDYAEAYWERMRTMQIDPQRDSNIATWSELALRFTAFAPGVSTALVGTKTRRHLEANVRCLENGPLDEAVRERIRAAFDPNWIGLV